MPKIRSALAIAGGALFLFIFIDRFVLIELFLRRIAPSFAVAGITALAATGCGWVARRWSGDVILNFVVGYPIFGAAAFLAGMIDVSTWTMVPLLLIAAVLGSLAIVKEVKDRRESSRSFAAETTQDGVRGVARLVAMAMIAATAVCALVLAQAPPSSLDELAYHLAVPRTWVNEGRVIELPLISHSYFPLGTESADLPSLVLLGGLGGGIASHFLHLLTAIATAVLVHRFTGRRLLITAAIATTPALAITAGWSLADWPLLGVCFALVFALRDDDRATIGAATAAGLLTKYTFIPFAIVAFVAFKRRPPVTALLGLVFFVRNLVLTGNPLAPFFSDASPHVAGYRGSPLLADYIFEGRFIDEALGAAVLILLPLARGGLAWLLIAAGAAFFFLAPSARLLLPFLAVPAALAVPDDLDRRLRRLVAALVCSAIVTQTALVAYFVERTNAFALLAGRLTDVQYLAEQRPAHAGALWIDASLPPSARLLLVGLNETFWFSRRVRGGGNFDSERLSRYLEAPTPEALRERLRRDGITHVAVIAQKPATTVAQKLEERQTRLTSAAQRSLSQLLDRYAVNVSSRGDATLFAIR